MSVLQNNNTDINDRCIPPSQSVAFYERFRPFSDELPRNKIHLTGKMGQYERYFMIIFTSKTHRRQDNRY